MGAVIVASRYVPRPPEDQLWVRKSFGPSLLLELAGNLPFQPRRWKFDYSEPDFWLNRSAPIPLTLLPIAAAPFAPRRWKFDHQDQNPGWVVESFPVPKVQALFGGNFPFKPPYWKYNLDDPGVWSGGPRNVNRVIDLAFVPPLIPSRWKYDNDDPAVWYSKPGAVPDNYLPVGGGFPFVPVRWRFNYDDASLWTVESFPVPKVQSLVGGNFPFKPPYWKYNNDDSAVWVGKPTPVNRVQDLVSSTPFVPVRWRFDFNDASLWIGAKSNAPSSPLLALLLANVPFKPRLWRDPQEFSVWRGAPRNVPLVLLPSGPAAISVSFAITEVSDTFAMTVTFSRWANKTQQSETWTSSTKQDETWTPVTIQDETWTPE